MPTNRQIEEAVARCVSLAVYYRNVPKAGPGMAEEARAVADWMAAMGLEGKGISRLLKAELGARYGPEEGTRITDELVGALRNRRHARREVVRA